MAGASNNNTTLRRPALSSLLLLLLAMAMGAMATSHNHNHNQQHEIHKRMSVDELRSTFHVEDHDSVPEYELVDIHHVTTRNVETPVPKEKKGAEEVAKRKQRLWKAALQADEARLKLKAFGRQLDLQLVRTDGLVRRGGLKLWTVEPNATAQHGVEYVEVPQTNDDIGATFQDEANEAAILLRQDDKDGQLLVEGSIGGELVVRPVPTHLRRDSQPDPDDSDDELFLEEEGEQVAIDTGLPIRRAPRRQRVTRLATHLVYKRGVDDQARHHADYELMQPDRLHKRHRRATATNRNDTRHQRSKREAPYTIYPEILVIVDYDGYRLHGGDNAQIKRYFVSFWNGVDLRYKLLKGPRVRISIAGIIISRGRDATPYLERNRVGRDAIDSAAALTDMGKYLFRERRLPVYDIAVAITKLDMCRRAYANDVCNRGTAGFAYVGGACVVNKRLEKVNSVAIIEDTGGFSGIIVAAHEVGHLLGAVHDGSPPPSYLGGPGAEKCRWEDGYIMSDLRHTDRGFRWSPCSISSFHHFLNGDTATCLFNAPHEDDSLPRVLPGKLLSLDAQCRKDRGTSACFKDDRVCAQLFCFDAGSGYCVAYRPAAEGSPCGDGQYCLNGQCVAEHENIIPDYSQNTPSYIRRQDNNGRPLFHDDDDDEDATPETPPSPQYYYYTTTTTTTTTTPAPPLHRPYSPSPPRPTTRFSFLSNYFSVSTTRSPYDFHNFGRFGAQTTSAPAPAPAPTPTLVTRNPYVGDYYALRHKTTKSPYDFANFGRATQPSPPSNNYLKRSYDAASWYRS